MSILDLGDTPEKSGQHLYSELRCDNVQQTIAPICAPSKQSCHEFRYIRGHTGPTPLTSPYNNDLLRKRTFELQQVLHHALTNNCSGRSTLPLTHAPSIYTFSFSIFFCSFVFFELTVCMLHNNSASRLTEQTCAGAACQASTLSHNWCRLIVNASPWEN